MIELLVYLWLLLLLELRNVVVDFAGGDVGLVVVVAAGGVVLVVPLCASCCSCSCNCG